MKQTVNPFLPSFEYIPDSEPHVFGDRVYLYGSHDRFDGRAFCMNDYVCWSAPVDDLKSWKYEGVIWKKSDDPYKKRGLLRQMYAPDVVRGNDGKFYLYYFVGNRGTIDVAVCDAPAGRYRYYGRVRYPDGTPLGRKGEKDLFQFDPAVFRDDERVYLYTGFAPKRANIFSNFKRVNSRGAMAAELEDDMLTVRLPLSRIAKTVHCSAGTGYEGHEFFEASSMRKFNGKYYFIYSSINGHELCYATGDSPAGEFEYGGVLVSIGDLGLSEKPLNYLGNTHGSVEKINGKYYVFYHRHTNGHCCSRQACAEEITLDNEGNFLQAPVTSCGLNGAPLKGEGEYSAGIACHLFSRKGVKFYKFKTFKGCHPRITQSGGDGDENSVQYIANFTNGSVAGFKYFDFTNVEKIAVKICGRAAGEVCVSFSPDGESVAKIEISPCKNVTAFSSAFKAEGVKPLYFKFKGRGRFKFLSLSFE